MESSQEFRELKGFDKHIAIVGFRDVVIEDVEELINRVKGICEITQLFDARAVAGYWHLYFSAVNALKAFNDGCNISTDPAVEILLFASGQRQIRKAIEMLGVSPRTSTIAALMIASKRDELLKAAEELPRVIKGKRDDGVLEVKGRKLSWLKRLFDVSDRELEVMGGDAEALSSLIIERVALLMIRAKG